MTLPELYKEETGKDVFIDIMGTACMSMDYTRWLENLIEKNKKKPFFKISVKTRDKEEFKKIFCKLHEELVYKLVSKELKENFFEVLDDSITIDMVEG